MAIVSEGGKVSRSGKSKLRAVPKEDEPKPDGAEPTPAATRCDLCGATDRPVSYVDGNAVCERCAHTPKPDKEKKKRAPKTETAPKAKDTIVPRSLADLARSYAKRMEKDEKTPATIAGYLNDLAVALNELGADTLVANLTPKMVRAFFDSAAVTKLRSGEPKSKLSIDKTRRVLRLALYHAVDAKWIERAPIPE